MVWFSYLLALFFFLKRNLCLHWASSLLEERWSRSEWSPAGRNRLVGDWKLAQMVANHLRFDFSLIEGHAIVDAHHAAAAAKLLQSCPTLCDPIDGSPPGSPIPGVLQARTLEWVAISFSNAWKWKVKVKLLSRVWLLGTPWTAAHQAPLPMGFSRQAYWSGVPLPSPAHHASHHQRQNDNDLQG